MNSKTILAFVAGCAIGSVVTAQIVKKKYEQIAQEEINSVKEVFSKKYNREDETEARVIAQEAKEKPSISEYVSKLEENGYVNYSNLNKSDAVEEVNEEEDEKMDRPYVINPDDFGEYGDYDKISLTYYADGVLADDNDELVEDVEDTVGFDSLNHFGEYEDDAVHVRNDVLKADYEILKDTRNYSDVVR